MAFTCGDSGIPQGVYDLFPEVDSRTHLITSSVPRSPAECRRMGVSCVGLGLSPDGTGKPRIALGQMCRLAPRTGPWRAGKMQQTQLKVQYFMGSVESVESRNILFLSMLR